MMRERPTATGAHVPEVTAVLLSTGESTASRALESVRLQTMRISAIVEVRNVRPFHRALNEGARRASTPYFVQVDADMVLDPTCVESLVTVMDSDPHIGIVIGFLRDDLVGRVQGIKVYRRECFATAQMPDSISPDTDFLEAIRRAGWRDVHALNHAVPAPAMRHTFGAHLPEYTPRYTYAKYLLEGARYRYRGDIDGLRWHAGVLDRSRHPAAPMARIGLLVGAFEELLSDQLGRGEAGPELPAMVGPSRCRREGWMVKLAMCASPTPGMTFRRYFRLGTALRRRGRLDTFPGLLEALAASPDPMRWVAQAGLCRGVVPASDARVRLGSDLQRLQEMLPSRVRWLRSRLRAVSALLRATVARRAPECP